MKEALCLDHLSKVYQPVGRPAVTAVEEVSLSLAAGETMALLGSSGCGKTSILRMIAGFEAVSSGSISVFGRHIAQLPPAQRRVAMAFEGYSLYPPLTVAENLGFALPARARQQRVRAIAEMLEIEPLLHHYPSALSAGQQQRVSLGRALIRSAELYLLDEPMGQLEPQLRAVLRGRIKHYLRQHGMSCILVTHDQGEAYALADRIAVMEQGRLQQFSSPMALKQRPANLFVGSFIGEPPMNILPVQARYDAGCLQLRPGMAEDYPLSFPLSFDHPLVALLTAGQSLCLGIRAIHLQAAESGLEATVRACYWLGDQSHIVLHCVGQELLSMSHQAVDFQPGDRVTFAVTLEDLHFFDAQQGQALAHGLVPHG